MVLLTVTFFALFPNPVQFVRHLTHLSDMNAMIEPDAPGLSAWDEEFFDHLEKRKKELLQSGFSGADEEQATSPPKELSARQVQGEVERFVYEKVQYAWDWDVWDSADYMPSVSEMFAQAESSEDGQMREDCDGRAVIAASLIRRLGYESALVTDLRHVWVVTPEGEWMGPGRQKTVTSGAEGNRTKFLKTIGNIPVALSYGIAVFPVWRELIILATAFALMLSRGMPWRRTALAALLCVQGLLFMRLGYLAPAGLSGQSPAWPAWLGGLHVLAGFAIIRWSSYRARQRRLTDERINTSPR